MGYFQVRCDSRVLNYDHRGFIRLATSLIQTHKKIEIGTTKRPFVRFRGNNLKCCATQKVNLVTFCPHKTIGVFIRGLLTHSKVQTLLFSVTVN